MNPAAALHRLGLARRFRDVPSAVRDPVLGPIVRAYLRDRARTTDRHMHIIGIAGHAGAGKDTVATLLQERRRDIARAAFADALKAEAAQAFGVDVATFCDPATKEIPSRALAAARCSEPLFVRHLGSLTWFAELRPRTVMQQWGDYRKAADPDYWVRRIEPAVGAARVAGAAALVITDVRYPNEVAWLRAHGGVLWRVVRPGPKPRVGHTSEWALSQVEADVTLPNDGYFEMLGRRVTDAYDELVRTTTA